MAETRNPVKSFQSWSEQFIGNQRVQKNIGEQLQNAWSAEDKFVTEFQDYIEGWCERRHEAASAAMEYAKKLTNGADQADIQKAWSEMTSAAMKRYSEDAQAQFSFLQKMATTFSPLAGPNPFSNAKSLSQNGGEAGAANSGKSDA